MNEDGAAAGIKGYEQSLWVGNAMNGVGSQKFAYIDAKSGYAGALGGTSVANLGVQDATFASGGAIGPERATVSYTRPLRGMQEIPLALGRAFEAEGGKMSLNQQLLSVEKMGDSDYKLTFRKTWSSPCTQITSFTGPGAGGISVVRAKHVIVTLTKSAIERVHFIDHTGQSGLADTVKKLTDAVQSAPALKYFAQYETRWWETMAKESRPDYPSEEKFNVGRITSSAQINNLFAWYPGVQQNAELPRACPNKENMGVIQNYVTGNADWTYAGTLRMAEQLKCTETEAENCHLCFNEDNGFVGPATNHAPGLLADAMRYQQAYVFGLNPNTKEGLDKIPRPTEVMYQLWSNSNPVTQTDACHYFKAGYKWWELYEQARDLTGDKSLSFIGETMSYNWFWGEGALETAEQVRCGLRSFDHH